MSSQTKMNPRRGILMKTTPADQGLVELPALTPHLQFHEIGEQQTLLASESFDTLLHGGLYCDLLPLLDGRRPPAEIAAALDGRHAAADVHAAIVSLSARGYVVSADHGMDRPRAAYWSSLGASPRWVEGRLAESRVAVEGDDGRLVRHLEKSGAVEATGDPKLTVIVCEDYLDARFAEVNRRRLEARAPWTLVRPRGMEALFGPVFRADKEGPCWDCLVNRLRCHKEVHNFLRSFGGEEAAFKPFAAEPGGAGGVVRAGRGRDRQMAGAGRGGPDSRTRDGDERRRVRKFEASGDAPAAVPGLRRRNALPAGPAAVAALSESESQSSSQQRRRAGRDAGGHPGEIPPPGEPDQRCRNLARAHDR